jgi:hypothetical protein
MRSRRGRLKDARTLRTDPRRWPNTHREAETPRETRSCLSAQVSLLARRSAPRSPCLVITPPRPGVASGIFGTESGPRQPQTTGSVSSRYLGFGVSQIPRRHRQFAFPPIPTGTPSRLTALARLGSLLRSVRPPGTDCEPNVEPSNGSNALDQHIYPLTCASVATERVTRQTAALRCPDGLGVGLSRQLTERPHDPAPRVRGHPQQVDDVPQPWPFQSR